MKRGWIILILLLLLAGCADKEASPVIEASPAPTVVPTAAATAIPTPRLQQITIGDQTEQTAPPTPVPTPAPTPTPEPTPTPSPSPTPGPLEGIIIGLDPGHQLVYNPAPEPVAPGSSETKQKVAGGCRGVKSGVYEY